MTQQDKIRVLVMSDDCAAHTGFGTVVSNIFGILTRDASWEVDITAIALYPRPEDAPRCVKTILSGGPPNDEHGMNTLSEYVKQEGWPDIIFLLGDWWYWKDTLLNAKWKAANNCLASIWYYVPYDGIQLTSVADGAYKSADKLIAMSPFGQSIMSEQLGRMDIDYLPHGYDHRYFAYAHRQPSKKTRFGVVSRNGKRKNIWAIVQAYWDLPQEYEAELILHVSKKDLVGGKLESWVDVMGTQMGRRPVKWSDGINLEINRETNTSTMVGMDLRSLANLYKDIDCLVSAGREGFGLPYLEGRITGTHLILPAYSAHYSMNYPEAVTYPCPWTRPEPTSPDILDICPAPSAITNSMIEICKRMEMTGGPSKLPEGMAKGLRWESIAQTLFGWIKAHGQSKKRLQFEEAKEFISIPWPKLLPPEGKPRIGFVMPESHGDVLLCTGVVNSLKEKYPNHEIDFITKKPYFSLLEGCPWISRLIEYNPHVHDGCDRMLRIYTAYFTPHFTTQRTGNWTIGGFGGRHLVEVYANACNVDIGDFWIPTALINVEDLPRWYITFHPGSGEGQQKLRWYSHWNTVLNLIKEEYPELSVVQVGAKNEPLIDGVVDWRGKTTPAQLNAVINGAEMHLGIDSYPTHVAGLLGVPVVALFSNTRPDCTGPYRSDDRKFSPVTPAVRPEGCMRECHMLWCPIGKKDEGCMDYISVGMVCGAISLMLKRWSV